jgi:hypothetical protein
MRQFDVRLLQVWPVTPTKRRFSAAVFMAAALLAAPAAPAPREAIEAGLEVGVQVARDDALVPLAHTGPRLALAPRYYGEFGPELLIAEGRLGAGIIVARYGEAGLTFSWRLQLSPLFRLEESSNAFLYLGPTLAFDHETFFFADWDDAHAYWIGARWLGPRVHGARWLSARWRLDFDGQVALFGTLSRPPAYRLRKQETSEDILSVLGFPTQDPELAWLADFQIVRLSVDFRRMRARARVPTGLALGAELAFARAVEPSPAFSFETTFRLSYAWGL